MRAWSRFPLRLPELLVWGQVRTPSAHNTDDVSLTSKWTVRGSGEEIHPKKKQWNKIKHLKKERKQSVLRSETTASIVQTLQKKQPAFMFHWQTARAAEWIWRRGCDGSKGSLCRIQWQLQLKMADNNQLNTPHHWRGVKRPLETLRGRASLDTKESSSQKHSNC